MDANKILALVLIAIGIVIFGYQGITYKTREKALDLGSIQVTTETTKTIPLPPLVGGIVLVGGIAMLLMDAKKGKA